MDKEDINNEENFQFSVLVALVVLAFTIIIFFIYKSKRSTRRGIILTGLSNSGKTLLFTRLIHKQYVDTHTSMKENIGDYIVNNKYLRIIDIPGHERLREKYLDTYKKELKAIVYVIDSSLIQQEVRDIAEYLYNILSNSDIRNFPVLILCNKQDIPLAKNHIAIKSILEKELSMLQRTKANQLDSVDPKASKANLLVDGDKFNFASVPSLTVEFADVYAANAKDDKEDSNIDSLEKWLKKVA